jgi:hypothetical protein
MTTSKEIKENQEITVLLTTEDYLIRGKISLPHSSVVENPTSESLLFYLLNSGMMFLSLNECVLTDRKNLDFKPEEFKNYNINLNIVHSCRIVD